MPVKEDYFDWPSSITGIKMVPPFVVLTSHVYQWGWGNNQTPYVGCGMYYVY
jgi:hypothetical protein